MGVLTVFFLTILYLFVIHIGHLYYIKFHFLPIFSLRENSCRTLLESKIKVLSRSSSDVIFNKIINTRRIQEEIEKI
ncbi:hypothetical protein BpHYR1_013158 [Brachionus plicatilis]|uniref:Uncharacterized protein n=1 Tax=Brachionus plicatilis TaxID=10195 RepID=A0A3M7RQS9_BRAPC|nr:hypothetical protein BpHYR1_013158 [Brachionus plicatilis]